MDLQRSHEAFREKFILFREVRLQYIIRVYIIYIYIYIYTYTYLYIYLDISSVYDPWPGERERKGLGLWGLRARETGAGWGDCEKAGGGDG